SWTIVNVRLLRNRSRGRSARIGRSVAGSPRELQALEKRRATRRHDQRPAAGLAARQAQRKDALEERRPQGSRQVELPLAPVEADPAEPPALAAQRVAIDAEASKPLLPRSGHRDRV